MKQTKILMGMPITLEVSGALIPEQTFEKVFSYFQHVDNVFSTYKQDSEISRINRGELALAQASAEMQEVFKLAEQTKNETNGYFNIQTPSGEYDPSGLVKGWAIYNAAKILEAQGYDDYFVEAGGDVQVSRKKGDLTPWKIGIRSPFNIDEIVKVLALQNGAVATSGTYIRGEHIYNPLNPGALIGEIVSLTIIGRNIYEADRFATAAFAMGKKGILFIENLPGFEGYMIDTSGKATMTTGFNKFILK